MGDSTLGLGKYMVWVREHVPDAESAYGQCAEFTAQMMNDFPELQRHRGYYHCHVWGKRAHWWCTSPTGEVVDPTAHQFPSQGCGEYEPLPADAEEPNGRCMNCGAECFASQGGTGHYCSLKCLRALEHYYCGSTTGATLLRDEVENGA